MNRKILAALLAVSLGAVAYLSSSISASAAELTIVSPTKDQALYLGGTLTIEATGSQATAILTEVNKGVANRKLRLYLAGIEIPGLQASYRVTDQKDALQAKLAEATAEVTKKTAEAAKVADNNAEQKEAAAKAVKDAQDNETKAKQELARNPAVDLSFIVDRDSEKDDSRKAWDTLLRSVGSDTPMLRVDLAVGTANPVPVEASQGQEGVGFEISDHVFFGRVIGFVCGGLCLLLLWWKSSMLREGGDPQNAFSLSRVQMAFWGVVVLSCFVGVAVACHSLEHIPAQTLVLLGISAATGLSSVIMDGGPNAKPTPKSTDPKVIPAFFEDICVSDKSAGFHRVQMVLWTLVLGAFFVWNVMQVISMPEFSNTLLILMGITNGTYLGFKTQEPPNPTPAPPPGH